MMEEDRIVTSHLRFAEERGDEKTYCPSEVARELYTDWRPKMDIVRKVADELVKQGKLYVLQKGIIQSDLPSKLKGPIRLRRRDEEE